MGWSAFFRAVRKGEYRLKVTTWMTAVIAVIYTLIPVDLIPELVLGPLGFVDDLGLWGVFVMLATREKNNWEATIRADPSVIDVEPN